MATPQTTLSAAITTTNATTASVSDVLGFPSTGTFVVLVDTEQILIGAGGSTTSWTSLTRGFNSTTAATHLNGATVTLVEEAYATLAALKASMQLPDTSQDTYLISLLASVTRYIDTKCQRSFFRSPRVSGDGSFLFDVDRPDRKRLSWGLANPAFADGTPLDVISITTLELADYEGATYNTVAAGSTGYWLLPGDPALGSSPPYDDIELSRYGARYTAFPVGRRVGRLTGVAGFTSLPPMVVQATIDGARELYRQGPGGGSPIGVNQYGVPLFNAGMPLTLRTVTDPTGPYVKHVFTEV